MRKNKGNQMPLWADDIAKIDIPKINMAMLAKDFLIDLDAYFETIKHLPHADYILKNTHKLAASIIYATKKKKRS